MKYLRRFAAISFGFIVIVFAVANRGMVKISLDPLPFVFEAPLYSAVMGGLAAGFVAGTIATWLAGHAVRRRLRLGKARIASLEGQVSQARASSKSEKPSKFELARPPADAA